MKINKFSGKYRFLSNFHPVGEKTAEHWFQAGKTVDPGERLWILSSRSPAEAKQRGRSVPLRADWEEVKLEIMLKVLRWKFKPGSQLAQKLIATGDSALEEGNTWGDRYWGTVNGIGENHLGKLLMQVREELR